MEKESITPEKLKELRETGIKRTERGMECLAKLSKEEVDKIKKRFALSKKEREEKEAEEEWWKRKSEGRE